MSIKRLITASYPLSQAASLAKEATLRKAIAASHSSNRYHRHVVATRHAIEALSLTLIDVAIEPCQGLYHFAIALRDRRIDKGVTVLGEKLRAVSKKIALLALLLICTLSALFYPPTLQVLRPFAAIEQPPRGAAHHKSDTPVTLPANGQPLAAIEQPPRGAAHHKISTPVTLPINGRPLAIDDWQSLYDALQRMQQQCPANGKRIELTDYHRSSYRNRTQQEIFHQLQQDFQRCSPGRQVFTLTIADRVFDCGAAGAAAVLFEKLKKAFCGHQENAEGLALRVMDQFHQGVFVTVQEAIIAQLMTLGLDAKLVLSNSKDPCNGQPITAVDMQIAGQQATIAATHYFSLRWHCLETSHLAKDSEKCYAIIKAEVFVQRQTMEYGWKIVEIADENLLQATEHGFHIV